VDANGKSIHNNTITCCDVFADPPSARVVHLLLKGKLARDRWCTICLPMAVKAAEQLPPIPLSGDVSKKDTVANNTLLVTHCTLSSAASVPTHKAMWAVLGLGHCAHPPSAMHACLALKQSLLICCLFGCLPQDDVFPCGCR
jgi:hypothetical protein